MTLIATYRESAGAILLVGDSAQTDQQARLLRAHPGKLRQMDGVPIAWGCAGNPEIGEQFGDALARVFREPPGTWGALLHAARMTLKTLNDTERGWRTEAVTEEDLGTILLAGFVGAEGHAYALEPDGAAQRHDREWWPIGSGRMTFHIALETLRQVHGLTPLDRLGLGAAVTTMRDPQCARPLHFLRLTPEGVEDVPDRASWAVEVGA